MKKSQHGKKEEKRKFLVYLFILDSCECIIKYITKKIKMKCFFCYLFSYIYVIM